MPPPHHPLQRLLRALASRRLAAVLLLSWAGLLAVWVVPFQLYGVPAARVREMLGGELFFRVVYVAVGVDLVACLLLQLRPWWARIRRGASVPRLPSGESAHSGVAYDADRAEALLRASGYRLVERGDVWVSGVARRWGTAGTLLFHASFTLAAVMLLLSLDPAAHFSGKAVLLEGETFRGSRGPWMDVAGSTKAPDVYMRVRRIETAFYRDILLFTRLVADVTDAAGRERQVAVSDPWQTDPFTQVAIEDFGWGVELTPGLETTQVTTYRAKLFPPGTADQLDLSLVNPTGRRPFRMDVRAYGDPVTKAGKPAARSFNLSEPVIVVSVYRTLVNGSEVPVVSDRVLRPGGVLPLGDGYGFTFRKLVPYGVFRVTRDLSAPFGLVALSLAVAGLLMRLAWPRTQAVAFDDAGGTSFNVRREVYGQDVAAGQALADRWDEVER